MTATVADSDGDRGRNEQPDRWEGATALEAVGGVTVVHEAEAWVDLISRADPSRAKSSKEETQEWLLDAILVSPSFPVFLGPDLTPF